MSYAQIWLYLLILTIVGTIWDKVCDFQVSYGSKMQTFGDWWLLIFSLIAIGWGMMTVGAVLISIWLWNLKWMLP